MLKWENLGNYDLVLNNKNSFKSQNNLTGH